jgi:uncharacterized protein
MRLMAAALVLLASASAFAQTGPSFDCAKASTVVERTICKDAALARADRDMASAYTALAGRLSGPAKDQFLNDQAHWVASRNRACAADIDGVAACLKERYAARVETLRAFADGIYPFISEQSLARSGKLGKITWSYDIAYPQFDGQTADFSAVNARFANAAKKAAEEGTPKPDSLIDVEQAWTYEQNFRVYRPSANAVTVAVNFYGFTGGAHGYGATHCTLVDLRTGKAVGPDGVFEAGDRWLKTVTQLVGAGLKKQFVDNPGFDEALEPASLAKLLRQPGRYCWRADRLELVFNAYEVGPYSAGSYEVAIRYDDVRSLLRVDGPVPR